MAKDNKGYSLSAMLSRFITGKLQNELREYIQKIEFAMELGLKKVRASVRDLKIRPDALDQFHLPIQVMERSKVGNISCKIPLAFKSKSIKVKFTNVKVVVRPNLNQNWSDSHLQEIKTRKLDTWEKMQKQMFRDEANLPGILLKYVDIIMANAIFQFKNIEILYEDSKALKYPALALLKIARIKVVPTNEEWKEHFSTDTTVTYRKIKVKGISFSMYCDKPKQADQNPSDFYANLQYSERNYVIKPINRMIIYLKQNKTEDYVNDPKFIIEIILSKLECVLNQYQRRFIEGTINYFNHNLSYQKYRKYKPDRPIFEAPKAWWKYIVEASRHDLKICMTNIFKRNGDKNRYVNLYKKKQDIIHRPWLEKWDEKLDQEVADIESRFSVDDLIWFRSFALNQLRLEAMTYIQAKGNIKGEAHIGDVWEYCLNDFESLLGDPNQKVAEEQEIELTEKEKNELNVLMYMDKQKVLQSWFKGESNKKNDKHSQWRLTLHYFSFSLVSADEPKKTFQIFDKKDCSCSQWNGARRGSKYGGSQHSRSSLRNTTLMAHSNNQPQYANLIPEEEEQNEGSSGYTSQEESKSCREDNPDFERDDQHMYPSLVDAQDYSETKPVIDIMATDHTNSELLDPKLVQDQTILILELRNITGKITWNNDKRIYVKDDEDAIQICEFSVTDPLSWKDPDRRKFLNDRYGSQSAEDLLSRTLQNEFALSALRFYMKQVGLGAEYEFFVHYREVKEKPLNMCKCSCMQNYDDKDLVNVFFGIEGERFLHVDTATRKQIYQNQPNKRSSDGPMKRVYDQIYKYIEETLFPQFLRSCSRYVLPALEEIQHHKQKTQSRRQKPGGNMLKRFITFVANAFKQLTSGSSEQSVRADNNFIFLSFDFAGEDYPIQIEFHDRKRKREESKEIEETGLNTLGLKISPVNLTMTSQAAVDIFNWVKTGDSVEIFDQPALKTTLKNAINETSEGIKMVFEFKKHSEKRPEQLYNIIMDQKKQMREIDFNIAIWSLKLTLLDDVHSTSFVEFPRTSIEINGVEISNPKQNDNEDVAQGFKPRHSIERDIKFYQNLHLYIEYVSIKNDIRPIQNPPPRTPDTQSVEILRTQLQMRHRKCIISNHPYIPDEIIDINIPFLNINVRPSLLQLILYLDTLNLLNTDNGPEGDKTDRQVNERREGLLGVEKQNQVDTRAVADEKIVKDELKKFNREHKKNMARCRHCLIFNQKIRKMIYFALGRTNPNSNMINGGKPGLNMSWYQTQTQDPRQPLFTLQLPLLAMIKHERCFSGDLSIFMREFSTRHASGEDFLILPCKTSMSQYPDIHYKAWQACPLFTEALNLDDCNEHQSVLFQFLTLREAYYRNYWNELPMPKCLRPSPRTHDKLEVNVGAIQLLMNKSIHESNLIMAIIGSTELISMYEKLRTQPKKVAGSQSKTESPLQVSVNVDQIEILVDNGEHSFYADLHSFQLEKLPHKRTGGRNEVSSYETLNVKADYIALNQGTLLFGMIRNFVLNIESYATMQRGTLTVKSLDLKTDTEEQGRENVLLCPAFVEEDQTGDCVVPQIKQCPKQENFFTGILTMSPKNNDYNFKFEPIGISLHFQTMKLLFENFHSLINPGKLKSRLPVFRFDSLLNVAQIRSQAQLDHQLPLTVHIKAPMITLVARIAEKPLSTLCVTEFEFLQEKISPPPPPPPQPKDRPLLQLEQPPPPKDQMIIQARDIKYKPYGYLIHDILEKVEDLSNPIVKVKIDNVQNLIKVKSSNIRLFFANKIIEDLIGFITELIPKSEAPPSKNYSENEEKPATKTLICIKNVYILVPKGTMCRDMLTAHVDNAIIEISDAVLKFKTPSNIDKRVIPWKSKNIIWDSEITEVFFNTTQVDINLHGIGAWLMLQKGGKIDIGRVGKTQITVQAPGDKAELQKFKWNLDTKIDVVISKVNLWTSLGRLTQIDQIVTANVDENSDYFDKVSKWEKTELNITTNEANVEIAKWLTLALSEQDMQHEISSVDVSNEEQVFPHIIEPKLNVKEESKQDAKKEQKQVHFQVSPSASSTRIQNIQKFPSESEAQKNIDNASGQQNPNHPNVKHPGLYVAMRAAKGPHQEQLSNINTAQELSQIIQMEEQVRTLEDQYRNNEDPVRSVQMDILQELYAIRECLASPEETLTSELQQLKDENTKLKYRIEHLKRHIN